MLAHGPDSFLDPPPRELSREASALLLQMINLTQLQVFDLPDLLGQLHVWTDSTNRAADRARMLRLLQELRAAGYLWHEDIRYRVHFPGRI